jgi:hypothetical protein
MKRQSRMSGGLDYPSAPVMAGCSSPYDRDDAAEPTPVRHSVKCKLFPDPFDERDPVGPCTCGATSSGDVSHE